ncbi:MAG: LPS export ABC transporter periplasmic protein LptC [Candidatus Neomarinimicrobiota bacterium]|nr:MAG: LPS export ABC transporter periplasmic protein LptC [Candidatus Neomarinimicrobiota bacterium]
MKIGEIIVTKKFQISNLSHLQRFSLLTFHVLLLILLFACSDVPEKDSVQVDKQYPDQESWGSEIVLTKEGKKRAVIDAGHLVKYNDRAVISMDEKVDVDFFDVHETHLSHLKSEEAKVNERTNDLVASGNVVVVSDSGVTLYTEELKWDHKREKIISDVFIKLVTKKDTLTGIGFVSDSNLENWVIHNPSGVTNRGLKK